MMVACSMIRFHFFFMMQPPDAEDEYKLTPHLVSQIQSYLCTRYTTDTRTHSYLQSRIERAYAHHSTLGELILQLRLNLNDATVIRQMVRDEYAHLDHARLHRHWYPATPAQPHFNPNQPSSSHQKYERRRENKARNHPVPPSPSHHPHPHHRDQLMLESRQHTHQLYHEWMSKAIQENTSMDQLVQRMDLSEQDVRRIQSESAKAGEANRRGGVAALAQSSYAHHHPSHPWQ